MSFCSANFEESRVTYGPEDSGDLSLRDACLWKPRRTNKRSSSQCWFQMKRRRWKRNERRTQRRHTKTKGKESPLCCIDGHPPHPKVRVHRWECSQEQSQVWKLWKCKLGQSLTKWLTLVINEKFREWTQNHPPVQVPSLNISECLWWILMSRGLWITVHHRAERKKTSIICVANLHSLPWNITSRAHKIRTTLKRRWIFKRASGNCCLYVAGKTGLLEKQQRQQQSHVNTSEDEVQLQKRKRSFERTEFGLWFLDDRRGEDIIRDSHLQVYFETMIDVTAKKREQRIGILYFQYWERGSVQNPQINWKENSRVRIGRIAFTAEASNL